MDEKAVSLVYEHIKALFEGCDANQLALLDGAFWECARMRVELNALNAVIAKTGHVRISEKNPAVQKELPVSRVAVKIRANYLNYIAKLSGILGKVVIEEESGLEEFE